MSIMLKAESQEPGLVEDGVYPATLTNIKQFENAYGPRLGFEFTLGGKGGGVTVLRSTTPQLTPQSKLAGLIRGLTGAELPGGEFDLESLLGKQCQVLVRRSTNKNGKTYCNVEQVFRLGAI